MVRDCLFFLDIFFSGHFLTDCFKAIPLLQFFVRAPVVLYVAFVLSLFGPNARLRLISSVFSNFLEEARAEFEAVIMATAYITVFTISIRIDR